MRQGVRQALGFRGDSGKEIQDILDDFSEERAHFARTQRAILNILEDFGEEKAQLAATQKAFLNILEDSSVERERLAGAQRAILNVLEDSSQERAQMARMQSAILNILEDLEAEKSKVEEASELLRREVEERRQAQEALQQRTVELARSNAELVQFAYVASHDLQEPLRMVSSYVQLLEQRYGPALDDKARKYIRYAVDGAVRMQRLIFDLLAYSRVTTRAQPHAPTDMGLALREALENLAAAIEESGARVTSDPLPVVRGDRSQLVQVFQNLVANGIKFRGDRPPQVHVSAREGDGEWVLCVQDNGIGIEPRHFERIFVIFQRLHTRTEYPGTGIGLALCKRIVERHGGRIWVRSEPGEGSAFCFSLPKSEPAGENT